MKTTTNFAILLLVIIFIVSCKKENPFQSASVGRGTNNGLISPVPKDTCTHGRQYYLNFKVDSTNIVCNTNLWAGSYFDFDIQMNGNFSNGYIYLVAFYPLDGILTDYPINYWNSITLLLNDRTYYAGREYAYITGSGNIRVDEVTKVCVKGSFECQTGVSEFYGTSEIKQIKNGVFHLERK